MDSFYSHSSDDTFALGLSIGKSLPLNTVVCLTGDLAAGKTTIIKGIAKGAADVDPLEVHSPTFTFLHIYEGNTTFCHFDLYRLKDIEQFLSMGFDEYLEAGGICCIEWSERITPYLPKSCMYIHIEHAGKEKRKITITQPSR